MPVLTVAGGEDDFERVDLSKTNPPQMPDINENDPEAMQPYHRTSKPGMLTNDSSVNELILWGQFFSLLLKTGGWTVAVLLAFRFVLVPLLTVGNSPVALILASAVSIFLVLCAIGALVKELKR